MGSAKQSDRNGSRTKAGRKLTPPAVTIRETAFAMEGAVATQLIKKYNCATARRLLRTLPVH